MQKINFIENGVLRLPPGFRFHPTDEELLVQYLQRKVVSAPLPACIIPEVDACKSDPWDLPGDLENERYFFSTKEAKYPNGNRTNRATCSGYWKATGADKQISSSKNRNQVVGMKKTLVFYRGKPPHGARTDWIMHEYRLVNVAASDLQGCVSEMENWVLCRIFLKKRSNKIEEEATAAASQSCIDDGKNQVRKISRKPLLYDLNVAPPCMSSSGQSEITEISNYEFEDNEENSSCNSFLMSVSRKP